jgi:ABC-2 type transport system ATP-binding protein
LEIALGIIHEPEVLFMDEPSTGLDPQNRANLWVHIRKLKENGTTIFLTTHYLDEADELADRLAIIDHGKIVAEGTPLELKQQVTEEEIAERLKKEVRTRATLDDVFLKVTGRSLRDTGKEDLQ